MMSSSLSLLVQCRLFLSMFFAWSQVRKGFQSSANQLLSCVNLDAPLLVVPVLLPYFHPSPSACLFQQLHLFTHVGKLGWTLDSFFILTSYILLIVSADFAFKILPNSAHVHSPFPSPMHTYLQYGQFLCLCSCVPGSWYFSLLCFLYSIQYDSICTSFPLLSVLIILYCQLDTIQSHLGRKNLR